MRFRDKDLEYAQMSEQSRGGMRIERRVPSIEMGCVAAMVPASFEGEEVTVLPDSDQILRAVPKPFADLFDEKPNIFNVPTIMDKLRPESDEFFTAVLRDGTNCAFGSPSANEEWRILLEAFEFFMRAVYSALEMKMPEIPMEIYERCKETPPRNVILFLWQRFEAMDDDSMDNASFELCEKVILLSDGLHPHSLSCLFVWVTTVLDAIEAAA